MVRTAHQSKLELKGNLNIMKITISNQIHKLTLSLIFAGIVLFSFNSTILAQITVTTVSPVTNANIINDGSSTATIEIEGYGGASNPGSDRPFTITFQTTNSPDGDGYDWSFNTVFGSTFPDFLDLHETGGPISDCTVFNTGNTNTIEIDASPNSSHSVGTEIFKFNLSDGSASINVTLTIRGLTIVSPSWGEQSHDETTSFKIFTATVSGSGSGNYDWVLLDCSDAPLSIAQTLGFGIDHDGDPLTPPVTSLTGVGDSISLGGQLPSGVGTFDAKIRVSDASDASNFAETICVQFEVTVVEIEVNGPIGENIMFEATVIVGEPEDASFHWTPEGDAVAGRGTISADEKTLTYHLEPLGFRCCRNIAYKFEVKKNSSVIGSDYGSYLQTDPIKCPEPSCFTRHAFGREQMYIDYKERLKKKFEQQPPLLKFPQEHGWDTSIPDGYVQKSIFFKPVDSNENELGPERGDEIKFEVKNAQTIGPLVDNQNGEYLQKIEYKEGTQPKVEISVGEVSTGEMFIEEPPKVKWWLWALIALAVSISFNLYLVLRRSKRKL